MFIHKLIISQNRNVYNLSKYKIRVCQLCINYHFKHKLPKLLMGSHKSKTRHQDMLFDLNITYQFSLFLLNINMGRYRLHIKKCLG